MNLISILSEIKVVPAKSAGGLVPGDLTDVNFRANFNYKKNNDTPHQIELTIGTIDKVKETPKNYRVWENNLKVYFYPETKTYKIGEIKPSWNTRGDLYDKNYPIFKNKNNLSEFSLDYMKKVWARSKFEENKIDLKVLANIVDAFYKVQYYSSDPMDFVMKSSKEELFTKAYKELKQAQDSYVKVKDKIAEDNLDWIEPIALDLIQKYSNADMSTYTKS